VLLVTAGAGEYSISANYGAAEKLREGEVYFVSPSTTFKVTGGADGLTLFYSMAR